MTDHSVLLDNMRWVRAVAARAYAMMPEKRRRMIAFDDWLADGVAHALKQLPRYSPDRGRPTTFLAQVLNNHYINAVQRLQAKRRDDSCVVAVIGQVSADEESEVTIDPGVSEDHTYNDCAALVAQLMRSLDAESKAFLLCAMVSADVAMSLPQRRRDELIGRIRAQARRLNITFEHVWRAAAD